MGDFDASATCRNSTAIQFLDIQQIKSNGRSDDIHNRINRSDFMKMNLIDGRTMNLGFGLRHRVKDPQSQIALIIVQSFGSVNNLSNVTQMSMCMLLGVLNTEMFCTKTSAIHLSQMQRHSRQIQRCDPRLHHFEIEPCINQCGDSHVATDTRCTV